MIKDFKKLKIAVLMGGISSEREVSLKTGEAILNSLQKQGYEYSYGVDLKEETFMEQLSNLDCDIAFLALHGEYGEDGRVQSILDIKKIKYTGSDAKASAIAMDKKITKMIAESVGIKIPKTYKEIEEIKRYPVVVKPLSEGSSVGLYICSDKNEAKDAIEKLKEKEIIIEDYIDGEELTAGVLDGKALGVLKIKPRSGVYDFASKYNSGSTEYEFPAKIDSKLYELTSSNAVKIHKVLGLGGGTRSDFILTEDGKIYFLEVNTCPGMTETSLLPKLASLQNYTFDNLVEKILFEILL